MLKSPLSRRSSNTSLTRLFPPSRMLEIALTKTLLQSMSDEINHKSYIMCGSTVKLITLHCFFMFVDVTSLPTFTTSRFPALCIIILSLLFPFLSSILIIFHHLISDSFLIIIFHIPHSFVILPTHLSFKILKF